MKKFKWLLISLLLGVSLFTFGLYIGNLTPEAETGFTTHDIAIINLDEGVSYLDEMRNFGAELMTGMDALYQLTGLSDARNGLETGRFAAYIIIPPDFSTHVISINSAMPTESTFTFTISRYLEEETRLLAFTHVMAFQSSYSERLAALYLASILNTFHRGQDQAQFVLENDEIDLADLLHFEPDHLIHFVELEDFSILEHDLTILDTSTYHLRTGQIIEEHFMANQNFMLLSQAELAHLLTTFNQANDEFWESTRVEQPIPLLAQLEQFGILLDLASFFAEIDELNDGAIGIDTDNLADILATLSEIEQLLTQKQTTLTDTTAFINELHFLQAQQLAESIERIEAIRMSHLLIEVQLETYWENQAIIHAHQRMIHHLLNQLITNPDATFTDLTPTLENSASLTTYLETLFQLLEIDHTLYTQPQPPDYLEPVYTLLTLFLTLDDEYSLNSFTERQRIIIENIAEDVETLTTLTLQLANLLAEMDDELIANIDGLETSFETLTEQLALATTSLETITVEEVEIEHLSRERLEQLVTSQVDEQVSDEMALIEEKLSTLTAEQEAFITEIITSKASGQSELSGYVGAISNHDPSTFIDEQLIHAHIQELSTNVQTLEQEINETYHDILAFSHATAQHSDETISIMRDDIQTANTETTTRITEELTDLRNARRHRSEENQERLHNLTHTLTHTRTGSLVNHELVNIMTRPVEIQGNHDARLTVTSTTQTQWMLPTGIGILIVVGGVLMLDALVSRDVKGDNEA